MDAGHAERAYLHVHYPGKVRLKCGGGFDRFCCTPMNSPALFIKCFSAVAAGVTLLRLAMAMTRFIMTIASLFCSVFVQDVSSWCIQFILVFVKDGSANSNFGIRRNT